MISVVIPTYNSEKIIKELCDEIQNYISLNDEIIFVNDCSIDKTLEELNSIKKLYSNIVVINLGVNIGQVGSTLLGIKVAKGTKIITMDDDFQHHPKYIPTLVKELENTNSHSIVAKWELDETFVRNYGSLSFTFFSSIIILKKPNFRNTAYRIIDSEIKKEFIDFFISRYWIDPRRLKKKTHQINIDHKNQTFRPYSSFKSRISLATKHLFFDSYLLQIILFLILYKNVYLLIGIMPLLTLFQFLIRKLVKNKRIEAYKLFE